MARRCTLNVSITPEMARSIRAATESGRYQSASEMVREGLRLLGDRDRLAALNEVRAKIATGLDEARAGDLLDGEGVMREMEEQLSGRTSSARRPATTRRRRAG